MANQTSFSEIIKAHIEQRGYNVTEISDLLNNYDCWGFAYSTVCAYVNGTRPPDPMFVLLVAKILKLSEEQIDSLRDAIVGDFAEVLFYRFEEAQKTINKQK